MKHDPEVTIIYQEIIDGYSKLELSGNSIYLKHLDSKISSFLESIYLSNYQRLKKKDGLRTEEERVTELIESGYWSKKNDDEIQNSRMLIDGLKKSRAKQFMPSHRKVIDDKIKNEEYKIEKTLRDKKELIGTTIEDLCNKKKNLLMLNQLFFKDPGLKEKFFDEDNLDYENEGCLESLSLYSKNNARISDKMLKKIALSSFFINSLILSEEDIYGFYGKPIVNLTYNQSSLVHHGKRYINIFKEVGYDKIPFKIRDDADELVEWFEVNKNFKDIKEGGVVGGTKEDKQTLGIQDKNSQLIKTIKEKGGSLDMYSFNDLNP